MADLPNGLNWNRLSQEMTGNIRVGLAAGEVVVQSATAVDLPYSDKPNGGIPSLRIWRMPDAMVNLARAIDTEGSNPVAKLPRFSINIARYDEATGATVPNLRSLARCDPARAS